MVLAAAAAFPLVSLVMWLLMRAFPAPEPWFKVLHLIASLALSGAATLLVADAIERLLRRRAAN